VNSAIKLWIAEDAEGSRRVREEFLFLAALAWYARRPMAVGNSISIELWEKEKGSRFRGAQNLFDRCLGQRRHYFEASAIWMQAIIGEIFLHQPLVVN
jgi:hypothetical protein